ncbi:MAG TPA: outer membrane beta-barrel protein [Candidatus Angelobacter sp.]|nr:outer membrane beta-barrel protein [Candidatus Angelobacter sp.]
MRKSIVVFGLLAVLSLCAAAQSHEVSVVAGAKYTPSGTSPSGQTNVSSAFAFEVSYATQLISAKVADLELEVPLLAVPTSQINSTNLFTAKSYSSIYLMPGLRGRLGTGSALSPWAAAGFGFVRFGPSSSSLGGGPSAATASTKTAFNFGGGVDIRPAKSPVAFRGEIRWLYTGVPSLAVPNLSMHNNVLVGGGIVLRF